MAIERVGIIGAGTMGNGIAHLFARSGFHVLLCDVEQRFLDRGLGKIAQEPRPGSCQEQNHLREAKPPLSPHPDRSDRAKLAIAISSWKPPRENFEIKAEIFRDLDRILTRQ